MSDELVVDDCFIVVPVQTPSHAVPSDPYLHCPVQELPSLLSLSSTSPASFGSAYEGLSDQVPMNVSPFTTPSIFPSSSGYSPIILSPDCVTVIISPQLVVHSPIKLPDVLFTSNPLFGDGSASVVSVFPNSACWLSIVVPSSKSSGIETVAPSIISNSTDSSTPAPLIITL